MYRTMKISKAELNKKCECVTNEDNQDKVEKRSRRNNTTLNILRMNMSSRENGTREKKKTMKQMRKSDTRLTLVGINFLIFKVKFIVWD